jgi:RNA 2',3'-cyclic 3'-phosphodiesterase
MTRAATARLFVALDLPREIRAPLAAWARRGASSLRAATLPDPGGRDLSRPDARGGRAAADRGSTGRRSAGRGPLRLLDAEMFHVTLCFLGSWAVAEIEPIAEALAAACAEARPIGELALGAPLWLPSRRPRALAVELHDDTERSLQALQNVLARELAAVCDLDFELETTGAAGGGTGARARGHRFRPHITVARMRPADAPRERALPATPPLSFIPLTMTLYRSWLTPTEASYEGLATQPLAAPTG